MESGDFAWEQNWDRLKAVIEDLHALLDLDKAVNLSELTALVEMLPENCSGGFHRVVMMNLARTNRDRLAIAYALRYGIATPPGQEQYVGPLDAFTCYSLACARLGDYGPSRELFARLRPVRAVEEFTALVETLPLEELRDSDAVSYAYGLCRVQEIIDGREFPGTERVLAKAKELSAFESES